MKGAVKRKVKIVKRKSIRKFRSTCRLLGLSYSLPEHEGALFFIPATFTGNLHDDLNSMSLSCSWHVISEGRAILKNWRWNIHQGIFL